MHGDSTEYKSVTELHSQRRAQDPETHGALVLPPGSAKSCEGRRDRKTSNDT